MSNLHDLEHRYLRERLSAIEGGQLPPPSPTPAPAPTPAPGSSIIKAFDFTINEALADVAVARTGAVASRVDSSGQTVTAAANTLRWHYIGGVLRGVRAEPASTGQIANGRNIGGSFSVLGAAPTITANYGTAPNGLTESTRIQVAAGNAYQGVRLGVAGITGNHVVRFWARSLTGVPQEVTMRSPLINDAAAHTVATTWTEIAMTGSFAYPSNFYNFDIVAGSATAIDIEVWGADLQMIAGGTALAASPILSSGAGAARGLETFTFTVGSTGTYDVLVETHSGTQIPYSSQSVTTTWALAWPTDPGYGLILSKVTFYVAGTLDGTPGPSPAPPPPASITVSVQNAINDMTTGPDAQRANGTTAGLYHGIKFSSYDSHVAATPSSAYNFADVMDCILPWWWIWMAAGHNASNTRVRVRYPRCYILLDDYVTGTWTLYTIASRTRGFINSIPFASNDIGDQIWEGDGVSTTVRPGVNSAIELWPWDGIQAGPFSFPALNISLMSRVVGVYIDAEMTLVLHDPGGVDDRASARFIGSSGYDWYSRQNQIDGIQGRPQDSGNPYPIHANDGGYGKYKLITTTPQIVSCSPLQSNQTVGWPPPWGSWQPNWPYQFPPWTMTQQQFRDNHPSILD